MNTPRATLNPFLKTCLYALIFFGAFGVLGSFFLVVKNTGKVPPQPDKLLDRVLAQRGLEDKLSIAVMRNGHELYRRTPPRAEGGRVRTYPLGTLGDTFTAMAIMILHDREKLDFHQTAASLLPGLEAPGTDWEIRRLLSHSGGPHPLSAVSTDPDGRSNLDPDSGTGYDPDHYRLLVRVVAGLSGTSAAAFIGENILKPLDMNDTFFEAGGEETDPWEPGTWHASLEDLIKWEASFNGNRLVRLNTLLTAFRPIDSAGGEKGMFGFGWSIENYRGLRLEQAWDRGETHGAAITRFSEKSFAAIVLSDAPREIVDPAALGKEIGIIYMNRELPLAFR